MYDIDFLPDRYRRETASRQIKLWQLGVILLFGSAISATSIWQWQVRAHVEQQLSKVTAQHESATDKSDQLSRLTGQLRTARNRAKLYAFLQHPWPRSRVLAEITGAVPENITLRELRISSEAKPSVAAAPRSRLRKRETKQPEDSQITSTERDLQQLREQLDARQTIVMISGWSKDLHSPHQLVGRLAARRIFASVELRSIESIEDDPLGMAARFQAVAALRSGLEKNESAPTDLPTRGPDKLATVRPVPWER